MNWFISNIQFFELLSYIILIISAPIAVITYIISDNKEKADRQFGTYDALDDKFIEFQMLCLEKPYLNIFDIDDDNEVELTDLQKKEEIIAFSILFSIFERACIMYRERSYKDKGKQWEGWKEVMEEYAKRENFREAWTKNGFGWDHTFKRLMDDIINQSIEEKQNVK